MYHFFVIPLFRRTGIKESSFHSPLVRLIQVWLYLKENPVADRPLYLSCPKHPIHTRSPSVRASKRIFPKKF